MNEHMTDTQREINWFGVVYHGTLGFCCLGLSGILFLRLLGFLV